MTLKERRSILVIDVESTCWQDPKARQVSEIIEIGITEVLRVDDWDWWKIGDSESIAVTNVFSHISPFCTHLTGWTQDKLDLVGIDYCDAVDKLKKQYHSKECIIACWGKYDDKMFQNMSKMHKCGYPFNNDYLNVKALFAAMYGGVTGVGSALEYLGMEFEGRPHSGVEDSKNITKLLLHLLEKCNG